MCHRQVCPSPTMAESYFRTVTPTVTRGGIGRSSEGVQAGKGAAAGAGATSVTDVTARQRRIMPQARM